MSAAWRWRNLSLQRRLMLAFTGFCILTTSLFSLYALAFAYTVEDQFFDAMLAEEARRQLDHHAQAGQWLATRDATLNIYRNTNELPSDLRAALETAPDRHELAGEYGRHYHFHLLTPTGGEPVWLVAEVSEKLVFRRMRGTVFEILLYSTLGLLSVALLLAWGLARSTAKPLSRLAHMLADLKPDQLPAALPQDDSAAEVGVLTRGLNDLVQRVRQFIEREQEFTRDVSHELRTPLTVISCAAEQIAASAQVSPAATQQLALIQNAAAQLQQTINTLLTIAREEHGKTSSHPPIALLPVIERVVVEQSALLNHKQVELVIEIERAQRTQLAEPVLHILLSNLIGNAFAHCAEGTQIDIRMQGPRLCIANQHPPSRQLDQAITPFQKHQESAGFGLGLSIVKRLSDRFSLDLRFDHQATQTEVSLALPNATHD